MRGWCISLVLWQCLLRCTVVCKHTRSRTPICVCWALPVRQHFVDGLHEQIFFAPPILATCVINLGSARLIAFYSRTTYALQRWLRIKTRFTQQCILYLREKFCCELVNIISKTIKNIPKWRTYALLAIFWSTSLFDNCDVYARVTIFVLRFALRCLQC